MWAYGATDLTSRFGYSEADKDVYLLGYLEPGTYQIQVDDYHWDLSSFDFSNISNFKIKSDYFGFFTQTKYGDGAITFTVGDSINESFSEYYVEIDGGLAGDAQYALRYDLIEEYAPANSPAVFYSATYTGDLEPGSDISASVSVSDLNGVSASAPLLVGWTLFNDQTGYSYQGGDFDQEFSITEEHVGQTLFVSFGFIDNAGFLETSELFEVGEIQSTSVTPEVTNVSASTSSITEGEENVTFTVATEGYAPGSTVNYSITGVSESDISLSSLIGTAVVGSNGNATVSLSAIDDGLVEETETLRFSAGDQTAIATITDAEVTPEVIGTVTAVTHMNLQFTVWEQYEGERVRFHVATEGWGDDALIPYRLSGISEADILGDLTGSVSIGYRGTGVVDVVLAEDSISDDGEVMTLTVGDQSASVVIKDIEPQSVTSITNSWLQPFPEGSRDITFFSEH